MKTLPRWTLIGFAALFVLCGTAVLIGRAQPKTAILPLADIQRCEITMCVFGIEPGKTSF